KSPLIGAGHFCIPVLGERQGSDVFYDVSPISLFRLRDRPLRSFRFLGIVIKPVQYILQQLLAVSPIVDDKVLVEVLFEDNYIFPEYPNAERVECAYRSRLDSEHLFDATCHFLSGFFCKGDGENPVWLNPLLLNKVAYLVRKDFGLTATRACQKQQSCSEMFNGSLLFLIQPF